MTIKYPQDNAPVERVHQLISNMIVTKDLAKNYFSYIDTWGKTLVYISWAIRASYNHTIQTTIFQSVFGRDMISNLASVVYQRVLTAEKQQQVEIDHVQEKARIVTHDYIIGNQVYVSTETGFTPTLTPT